MLLTAPAFDSAQPSRLRGTSVRKALSDHRAHSHGSTQASQPSRGIIYFVQVGTSGPVKIGWTAGGARNRLSVLQSSHHEPLFLVRSELGTISDEKILHERFDEHRLRGEWFAPVVLELYFGDEAFDKWLDASRVVSRGRE